MNASFPNAVAIWSFWTGASIVVVTHVYMLIAGLPASQMTGHAILNLIAAGLVIFGHTKRQASSRLISA